MNDNDLGRLVNLLSYLKKHDDVEQELGKARSHHASGRTNVERDETQTRLRTALGVPNHLIRSVDELPEGAEATYRRMLGKNGMAKSSESILLSLLKRLGT
jgi:hypothetical protein